MHGSGKVLAQTIDDAYAVYHGDCIDALAGLPSESVHLTIYSPPFSNLYLYSPSERDLGNCMNEAQFFVHHGFVADELLRATKPGRNIAMHVQQVPAMLVRDQYIGLKDFRGWMIAHMIAHGWTYAGEVCCDTNPQAQAIRIRAKGLAFHQLHRDSVWSRPALAQYILLFRKPGENAVSVVPDVDNETWIEWASPVWYSNYKDKERGWSETHTLNTSEAKENDDDRHICPLSLDLIERCIRLWSNPPDIAIETVLDPFSGIGSTGFVALQHGRKFIGMELKESYYATMLKNLQRAQSLQQQLTFL